MVFSEFRTELTTGLKSLFNNEWIKESRKKLKSLFNNEWIKESRKKLKMRKERETEKEKVSLLFDGLSESGRKLCLYLLGESDYALKKYNKSLEDALNSNRYDNISLEDEKEQDNLKKIISIIKDWHPRHKRDCLNKLCTKDGRENVFIIKPDQAENEDEESVLLMEQLEFENENERRKMKEKKKNGK